MPTTKDPEFGQNCRIIHLIFYRSIAPEKKEKYLRLLKEVMETNSNKSLNEFLVAEEIISFKLNDLKREPGKILRIIRKIEENIEFAKFETHTANKFRIEFNLFREFLSKRIMENEYVLIEYSD